MKPEHVYADHIYDSARWEHFRPRAGDIVVATPPKCGTTWTQMICALLVHQTADFPQPLTELSRWLERHREPVGDIVANFEAQKFRRIVKTHTPLDGLPLHDEVTYVFCGRDPRDAFLSGLDHLANISKTSREDALSRAGLPLDAAFPNDPNVMFPLWLTRGTHPWVWDGWPLGSVMYLTDSYWRQRSRANIVFLHYADMLADLDGEMRRLSEALGIAVDEARWPALVRAASFTAMRENADSAAPGAHFGEWSDNASFFAKARQGEWRHVLTAENQALYERVSAEKLSPELKRWLERGRLG